MNCGILYLGISFFLMLQTDAFAQVKKNKRIVIVKDSTKYSKQFLKALGERGYGTRFELIDDSIFVDGKYKVGFAQFLPEKKEIFLKGQKSGRRFELKLHRVNYTTITFDFTFIDENGKVTREAGKADKTPGIILGSESDTDDNGNGYFCSEYFSIDEKCLSSIRIGLIDKKIVAKVIGCTEKLTLENCPTLR